MVVARTFSLDSEILIVFVKNYTEVKGH